MAITREAAINRYIGLSTDAKPTVVPIGATFWEYDTKNIYKTYDGTNWALYDSLAALVSGTFLSSAATTTTITAAALADVAGQYVGQTVLPLEGAMAGEARYITAYNGTNTLTVSPAWASDPDAGGNIHFEVLAGANSIVVAALGTNGTTVTDSATTVLGAIGANNNNNAFDSTSVAANANGSVLEREAAIQALLAAQTANSVDAAQLNSSVGNKTDTAVTTAGSTNSIMAYAKGIANQTSVILPGVKLVTKTSTSTLTTGTLFNWAGSIQILSIIGRVTTAIQNQATTVKLGIQADALTIEDMCATLDINAFAVGTLLGITGTYADAMIGTTGVPTKPPTTPINATCITSGIIKVTYGAGSTGAIVWELLWVPLNATGSVTAA